MAPLQETLAADPKNKEELNKNKTIGELNNAERKAVLFTDYSQVEHDWVIKPSIIPLLPKFHGLTSENPFDHLQHFSWVCDSLKPQDVDIFRAMFRAFPWSLEGDAKRWFFELSMESVQTWDDMYREFLDEYFPTSKEDSLLTDLVSIKQKDDENLYQYYKRFQGLQRLCPTQGVPERSLIRFFYHHMRWSDKNRLDIVSGGANMYYELPPAQARKLIQTVANNVRHSDSHSCK